MLKVLISFLSGALLYSNTCIQKNFQTDQLKNITGGCLATRQNWDLICKC